MATSVEREKWNSIIDLWRLSGLSQAAFCRKQKITVSAFYYWNRKFSLKKVASAKAKKIGSTSVADTPDFVEITIPKADVSSKAKIFRITTSYGAVMEVPL